MVVLDTNIILLDANNIFNFDSKVIIPETVVDELDIKKSDLGELGYQSREFGRLIAKAKPLGTFRNDNKVESKFILNETVIIITSIPSYPDFKDFASNILNDRKIIHVASLYPEASFVSNDTMARIRAESLGIKTRDYRDIKSTDFNFIKQLEVSSEQFSKLHYKPISNIDPDYQTENYSYVFTDLSTGQTKLGTISNGLIEIIGKDTEKELRRQDVNPINAEQLFFSNMLQDTTSDLVVCEALSGSGKTATAISNGIRLVRQGHYEGILYIRSSQNDVDKTEEVGFLPGLEEKFAVYLHPLQDTLDFIIRNRHKGSKLRGDDLEAKITTDIEELKLKCNIQAMTTLGMRGRTFNNMYVIIDEAQNMSNGQLQKVLTRIGKGCKVIVIGSLKQIDNPYITKYTSGLSVLLDACKSTNEYIKVSAVTLHKVVRSPLAEFTERLFST